MYARIRTGSRRQATLEKRRRASASFIGAGSRTASWGVRLQPDAVEYICCPRLTRPTTRSGDVPGRRFGSKVAEPYKIYGACTPVGWTSQLVAVACVRWSVTRA